MNMEQEFMDVDVYDETDLAQWLDLVTTEKAIQAVRDRQKTQGMTSEQVENLIANSRTNCKDCLDPIDERRRVLQPGVEYCTDCQEYLDKKNRMNGFYKQ